MDQLTEFLSSPAGLIVAGVGAFLVGSMFFNVKQWEAHWKQWAIDTSKAMSKAGLIHTPKILDCLAVGDLAGAFREIKSLADIFKDPKQLAAEFATVFQNMLDQAFKDPTQAKALQQLANDAVAAFASGDPTKAEAQLAGDAQTLFQGSPLSTIAPPPALTTALSLPAIAGNPALSTLAQTLAQVAPHLLPSLVAGVSSQPAAAPAKSPPAASGGSTPQGATAAAPPA